MTDKKILVALNAELPAGFADYLWGIFEPRIHEIIKQEANSVSKEVAEEYMPMQYFLDKWKTSRQTFNKIAPKSIVNRYWKINCNVYNVAQAQKAYQDYKPMKPIFKNSFLKSA